MPHPDDNNVITHPHHRDVTPPLEYGNLLLLKIINITNMLITGLSSSTNTNLTSLYSLRGRNDYFHTSFLLYSLPLFSCSIPISAHQYTSSNQLLPLYVAVNHIPINFYQRTTTSSANEHCNKATLMQTLLLKFASALFCHCLSIHNWCSLLDITCFQYGIIISRGNIFPKTVYNIECFHYWGPLQGPVH